MLPQFYKLVVVNKSGQDNVYNDDGRLNMKITEWYIDPNTGTIVYNQRSDDDMGLIAGQTIANNGERLTSEVDNTSNKYVGAQIQLEVTHSAGAAADGTFDIYMAAGDATGELPTDANGYVDAESNKLEFVGSLFWLTGGSNDDLQRSPVFNI